MSAETKVRKLGTTVRGLIGTDWVLVSLARIERGAVSRVAWVREDGSNAFVPTMPTAYRTAGDVAHVAAAIPEAVVFSAISADKLAAHTWKPVYSLNEMAKHSTQGKALKPVLKDLRATYARKG